MVPALALLGKILAGYSTLKGLSGSNSQQGYQIPTNNANKQGSIGQMVSQGGQVASLGGRSLPPQTSGNKFMNTLNKVNTIASLLSSLGGNRSTQPYQLQYTRRR